MSKFKIDDVVRWKQSTPSYQVQKGALARVYNIDPDSLYVEWLEPLGTGLRLSQSNGGYDPEDFELFNPVPDPKANVGLNKDDGKLRVDLVPMCAVEAIAEVLGKACRPGPNGEKPKYPERNWENGISYSRIFANIFRHLVIEWWWKGYDVDPESGLHPLKHAICRLAMLLFYIEKGMVQFDDRPSKTKI